MAVYGIALGMAPPLLSLILEARGTDAGLIGLMAAMPALGMLAATRFYGRLVARLGLRPFLFACLGSEFVAFLALPALDWLAAWFVIRFVMGAAIGGLFVAAETWINQVAEEASRGRVVGVYVTMISAGFALGPLLLATVGTEGWTPFLIAAGFVLAALVPLGRSGGGAPRLDGRASFPLFRFARLAPGIAGACLVFALVQTALFALFPVYSVQSGLSPSMAAVLLAVVTVGNIALQYPIGWAADRVERGLVLLGCAAAGLVGPLLLPVLMAHPAPLWLMLFLWGGLFPGVYTVSLALLGQHFRGADLVTANAALALLWSFASLVGPVLGGFAMEATGRQGLPGFLALASGLYLGFVLWRHRRTGGHGY